jgi:nucleoside-diphosphate-sugar epimerase
MQNIIVTGGAGFIGTNLIIELLKDKNNNNFIKFTKK